VAEIQSARIAYVHRRIARATGWLAFAAAILPVAALAVLSRAGDHSPLLAPLLDRGVLAALPLAALSYLCGRDLFGWAGSIRREGEVVVIQRGRRERRLPATAVQGGIIVPERNRVTVELHLAGGDHLSVRVADVAQAEALLRELRVDVTHQRCRVQIADRAAARVVSLATPVSLMYFVSITFLIARIPANAAFVLGVGGYALLAALIQALIATPDVTVGTDGLAFRRGFRERFVPFTDLEDIRVDGLGARLLLRDQRPLRLPSIAGVSPARLEALKLRIREAMALRDAAPTQALAQLDRAGRSIPEWRMALGALARRGVDYRAAGLSADDLSALLVSPDATPERRLGAALALAASKHPAAPERIGLAAAQCASQRLRVALESVNAGADDDAALAEALEEEDEQARRALGPRRVVRP
jgi:hypothetical protein